MSFLLLDIFDRLSSYAGSSTDVALARLLRVSPQVLSGWKTRGAIPYKKICDFAINNGISLDYLLLGKASNTDHTGDIDITLRNSIAMAIEDYKHNHCAHDLELIYNYLINSIKPEENMAKAVDREIQYLIEIRRWDKLRNERNKSKSNPVSTERSRFI
jgi:hypothetical protein